MRWELVRCFATVQSHVPSIVCWHILTPGALKEVLLKADHEPSIQALVDAVQVQWVERTMVAKSPMYSHQSNGAVENAVRRVESLTSTNVCGLREKLGCKVDSKSVVLPWLVRHAAYVLSRSVKRDGRSAWAQ